MFRSTATIIKNQGERLIHLENENDLLKSQKDYANKKCLALQGRVDDCIDEWIEDLRRIENHLTRNDYDNPRAKIAIALEYVRDKIKELDNAANID